MLNAIKLLGGRESALKDPSLIMEARTQCSSIYFHRYYLNSGKNPIRLDPSPIYGPKGFNGAV